MGLQARRSSSTASCLSIPDRFERGVRQGNPGWLWLDLSQRQWQRALSELESATRKVLSANETPAKLDGDAHAIRIAGFTSGMGPLLGHWSIEGLVEAEPPVRLVVERQFRDNAKRMKRLADFAAAAARALANAGVNVTVLKGMHTAYDFFPTPSARPMSDIDLLIDGSDKAAAARVLTSLGYLADVASFGEQTWRLAGASALPSSLSSLDEQSPWSIDLHTSLDRKYSPGAPIVRMDRAIAGRPNGSWSLFPQANVLTGESLVLHLAYHASMGLMSLSMLRLTELTLVIRKLDSEQALSWDLVKRAAVETGCPACIYPALCMVNQLAPDTVPEAILGQFERNAPRSVSRVIAQLTPATCQRLARSSFEERFMWTGTIGGWIREAVEWVFPPLSIGEVGKIYAMRFWRLARRKVTRRINPVLT